MTIREADQDFERPGDDATETICFCMDVHEATIRRAIRAGHREIGSLRDVTRAGTGCGTCRIDLEAMLEAEAETAPVDGSSGESPPS